MLLTLAAFSSITAAEYGLDFEEDVLGDRIPVSIESDFDEELRNYPVKVDPGQIGDDACDDALFYDVREDRFYDYYIEGGCDEGFIWLQNPILPANYEDDEIYIYEDGGDIHEEEPVFRYHEDFSDHEPGLTIDQVERFQLNVLSGGQDTGGRAEINTDNNLYLESNSNYTSITRPFGLNEGERSSIEIKTSPPENMTIGFTDGRTYNSGEPKSGYKVSLTNTDTKLMRVEQENITHSQETKIGDGDGINSEGEVVIGFNWIGDTLEVYYREFGDIEEETVLKTTDTTFSDRSNLQISVGENVEREIEWIRERQRISEEPESELEEPETVETDEPDPELEVLHFEEGDTVEYQNFVDLKVSETGYDGNDYPLSAIFYSDTYGFIGFDEADVGEPLRTRWMDLNRGEKFQPFVIVCDIHNNCGASEEESFEVDYDGYPQILDQSVWEGEGLADEFTRFGLMDEDRQPQGLEDGLLLYFTEDGSDAGDFPENIPPAEESDRRPRMFGGFQEMENHIVMSRDRSDQLQPGMRHNYQGMESIISDPDLFYRRYDFIDEFEDDFDARAPLWFDSLATADRADQYALSPKEDWAVDTTGKPYPSGGVSDFYIRVEVLPDGSEFLEGDERERDHWARDSWEEETRPKPARVFANSIPVSGFQGSGMSGHQIESDQGYWLNPDDLPPNTDLQLNDRFVETVALTGPDSGIALHDVDEDDPGSADIHDADIGVSAIGDIYWEGAYEGFSESLEDMTDRPDPRENEEVHENLSPYMCGDDESEYLLEELGESPNSERFEGRFACATANDKCVAWDAENQEYEGRKLFEIGEYVNTNSIEENMGRTKNSQEQCLRYDFEIPRFQEHDIENDLVPAWYPQDLSEEICRENGLFDPTEGKRWFDKEYIERYPYAVEQGINQDLNPYLHSETDEGKGIGNQLDYFEYDDERENWAYNENENGLSGDPVDWNLEDDMETPVETGRTESSIEDEGLPYDWNEAVTAGFCAGDDQNEYFQYQECSSDFCPTNQSVIGVSSNVDSCILDNSTIENAAAVGSETELSNEDVAATHRRIYSQGEMVQINPEGEGVELDDDSTFEEIGCFGGTWYDEWPLVYEREKIVEVPFGASRTLPFRIINPTDQEQEYEVGLDFEQDPIEDNPPIEPHTSFAFEESDFYTTEVDGTEVETHHVTIEGNRENAKGNFTISVESLDTPVEGEVEIQATVTDDETEGRTVSSPQELPGPPALAVVLIMILSIIIKSRTEYETETN